MKTNHLQFVLYSTIVVVDIKSDLRVLSYASNASNACKSNMTKTIPYTKVLDIM